MFFALESGEAFLGGILPVVQFALPARKLRFPIFKFARQRALFVKIPLTQRFPLRLLLGDIRFEIFQMGGLRGDFRRLGVEIRFGLDHSRLFGSHVRGEDFHLRGQCGLRQTQSLLLRGEKFPGFFAFLANGCGKLLRPAFNARIGEGCCFHDG